MEPRQLIETLAVAALFAPLFSAACIILATRRVMFKSAGVLATGVMAGGFVCSVVALVTWLGLDDTSPIVTNIGWIPIPGSEAGWLYLGVLIDSLTVAILAMVTGISMLVHLYSIGYMDGDPRYNRFFGYLSLFTFSMLGIVLANSLLMLFVFWELVGLTSYLLIGFWFEKRGPQLACKKAFVMNRIGDMGFLVGFGILFAKLGGNILLPAVHGGMFDAIRAAVEAEGYSMANPPMWLTMAGIGVFFGAIGKSAQFPLHTWLPDAMEGPTPVSSIVHSATMVAAGVYLTARIYPILTPGAHLFIATIGLITLVMAACMALVMTDIKRVLAYSTLSQLGYMVLGLGAGAYSFALFHLITHAFFKCCLFQCSGSVIHAAHHQQDMRYYGGLGRKMPITMICYGICTLAIAGASLPFTSIGISGFYSKDGIIAGTVNYGVAMQSLGSWGNLFWIGPTVVAYITVFYMARSFALTFLGEPRDKHLHEHAHEVPWTMTLPQVCLAIMAVIAATLPFLKLIEVSEPAIGGEAVAWMQPTEALGDAHNPGMHATHAYLLHGLGWIIMLVLGVVMYRPGMKYAEKIAAIPGINLLYHWAHNKFFFDELYDTIAVGVCKLAATIIALIDKYLVDGMVNLAGWVTRQLADAVGLFDQRVVDGAVNGAAAMATSGGQILRSTQTGRVRAYVLFLFASATVVTLVVVTVVLVSP